MVLWVYIINDGEAGLTVGLKIALPAAVGRIIPSFKPKEKILYLRPFKVPFDALAHKHLLDHLSKETVKCWIKSHKEETKIWLNVI